MPTPQKAIKKGRSAEESLFGSTQKSCRYTMDNGLLEEQQQQRPRLHIIADDDDSVVSPSSSRADQHQRKNLCRNATVGHGDSQHPRRTFHADNTSARCCCYSSAPMPTCCMSALLNPKLASPHDATATAATKATASAFVASSPTATTAATAAQPLFRRRRSRCDDEDASASAFSLSMMDQNGHSHIAQQEIMAFAEAARITRTIGAAVIKRQAASINRQLLQFQMMQQEQQQKQEHSCSFSQGQVAPVSSHKRRKVQTQDQTYEADYIVQNEETHGDQECRDEQQVQQEAHQQEQQAQNDAIWDQVDRMKRMSMFLKNAQLAQSLFLQEMNECVMEQHSLMQQHCEDLGGATHSR